MRAENVLHAACRDILAAAWLEVEAIEDVDAEIVPEWADTILSVLTAPMGVSSSFRFVLPTQLVAKLADPLLDSRSLQLTDGAPGNFNARDVAKRVIVPFNREHGSPLGASGDPYVNNPLRVPSLSEDYRAQQTDKVRWDALCNIMDVVEDANDQAVTTNLLHQVLLQIRRQIAGLVVAYTVPARVSHELLMTHLRTYLEPRTGGRRLQAVCVALLRAIGTHWDVFDEVTSGAVNAADAPGARPADIECKKDGATVLAVEAKNVTLTLELLQDKIIRSRAAEVLELMFLIRADPIVTNAEVQHRANREFAAGQSIYLVSADEFMNSISALLGEAGRRVFVVHIGEVLDEYGLDYTDRSAWADLLNHW